MFESASIILNQYLKTQGRQLWRFDIYNIETCRGEDPSVLYYLCNVHNSWYIIFETEYIFSLSEAAEEAKQRFESEDFKLSHWLTKKNADGEASVVPLDADEETLRKADLVYDIEGTYLRCAVIAVEFSGEKQGRYDPMAYGNISYR